MTKNEFDALPEVVKFAIEASNMPVDKIEVKDGKITFPMPDGATDKGADDEDCEHCPARFICPDSTTTMPDDIRKAMRAVAEMFGIDDIDDDIADDDKDFVDNAACKKAWDEMDPVKKDLIEKLIELDVTDVDALSKTTGLDHAMCTYILREHGIGVKSDSDNKTFMVPVTGFVAVKGAPSEEIAIRIAKRVASRLHFDAHNVVDDPNEVYAASIMNSKGDIDADRICATCNVRSVHMKVN